MDISYISLGIIILLSTIVSMKFPSSRILVTSVFVVILSFIPSLQSDYVPFELTPKILFYGFWAWKILCSALLHLTPELQSVRRWFTLILHITTGMLFFLSLHNEETYTEYSEYVKQFFAMMLRMELVECVVDILAQYPKLQERVMSNVALLGMGWCVYSAYYLSNHIGHSYSSLPPFISTATGVLICSYMLSCLYLLASPVSSPKVCEEQPSEHEQQQQQQQEHQSQEQTPLHQETSETSSLPPNTASKHLSTTITAASQIELSSMPPQTSSRAVPPITSSRSIPPPQTSSKTHSIDQTQQLEQITVGQPPRLSFCQKLRLAFSCMFDKNITPIVSIPGTQRPRSASVNVNY